MTEGWHETGRFLIGAELFEALSIANRVFDLAAELPQQVFKEPIRFFTGTDALRSIGGDFSTVLNKLSEAYNDEWCCVLVLRAHSDDLVAGFRFDFPVDANTLWSRLNYQPDGDVVRSYTSVASTWVYFGSSSAWGCWADRDWELAIAATVAPLDVGTTEVPFQPVLAELAVALEMGGGTLSDQDHEAFVANFA
jgi:hypothetical protein